jgi:hypothetical protein
MDEIAGALVQALAEAARQRKTQRQGQLAADRFDVPGVGLPRAKMIRPTPAQQQAQRSARTRPAPAKPPAAPPPQEPPDDWRLADLGPDPMQSSAHEIAPQHRHLHGLLVAFADRHRLLGAVVVAEALRPPLALRSFDQR